MRLQSCSLSSVILFKLSEQCHLLGRLAKSSNIRRTKWDPIFNHCKFVSILQLHSPILQPFVVLWWKKKLIRSFKLKRRKNIMKETEKKKKNSWVPLYFVLYYTLNRSGEIYGKIDSFEIRSPLYIAHHRYDVKWSFIHFPKPGPQSHSLFTYRERSETPLKQHSCRHKWNEAQFTKYAPLIITTIQRLLKYDPGINDTFQKSAVGTH